MKDNKNNKSHIFCLGAVLISVFILLIMGLIVYLWDPYGYFRIRNNRILYVASAYIDAGIIRNADYDSVIIGSSLSQNFDPEVFRSRLGLNPIKACTGGLTPEQKQLFYDTAEQCEREDRKVDTYFIEMSLAGYNSEDDDMSDTPVYLYNESRLDDYRYLYGYETWMRGMPVSLGYYFLEKLGYKIDTSRNVESIDNVGEWYTRFRLGRDIVKNKYLKKIDAVTEQNTDGMYERMKSNVDKKLEGVIDSENEYIMFFPPYSLLFWHKAELSGYADCYMYIREYMTKKLDAYPNVRVFDFQTAPLAGDLDNYRDTTHYGKHVNDYMAECFGTGEYEVDGEGIVRDNEILRQNLKSFQEENKDWLDQSD